MTHRTNKIMSMRKVVQLSATFFMVALMSIGCRKEDTNIGENLQGESLNVKTDTIDILTYSEVVDSMESDETSVNMLGYYIDPVFGHVDCGIVTQLRLSSPVTSFGTAGNLQVDSVVLGLAYTSILFYANLEDVTLEVYEVADLLVRDNQVYYTDDIPNTLGTNLIEAGYETVSPDYYGQQILANGDTLASHLRVRLDPSLGQDWIDAHGSGTWSSEDDFVNYFKGLYIKADGTGLSSGQGSIMYFSMEDALSNVTVYYHDMTINNPEEFEFSINSSAARYNCITYDRTGTPVEAVLNDPSLGSESFYMQGSSIRAIIEIPNVKDLYYDSNGNYDPKIINKASLILPIQDYTPDSFNPCSKLFIARIVDQQLSDFTIDYDYGGNLNSSTVSYDEDNKEFRFTLTRELQAILNEDIANNGLRIYSPSFFGSTIERVIFNGSNTSLKDKPRLEVTYTDY